MKYLLCLFAAALFLGGTPTKTSAVKVFKSVEIDTLLTGDFNCRALLIKGDKLWYGTDKSRYGSYNLMTKEHKGEQFSPDTLDFRSIATNGKQVFLLNAGNPAFLIRKTIGVETTKTVYSETDPKVFYDSMQFWNSKEGIALGDPIDGCFSVLITRNGGESWKKISCKTLPAQINGEAAFAASNTNIVVKGNLTWLVTGGAQARVFFSPDKGKSWKAFATPIVKGKSMTGIFTADFYDSKTGIIAGGDYERPNQKEQNKAITRDGGKTWTLIADGQGFGYASCVQFVPKSKGKSLVSVGASGLHYSSDGGENWKQLHNDYNLYTLRFQNDSTAFAAGKGKIIRIRFKE